VSDRTIRRWKMELERTGRIGKPPESRTGRHRVLNPEVETVSHE
jgi:transposase